jgi:uncharacterized protein (TIGR02996 family)
MSDGEALRAAIHANPTDATARLVYADWLDENDQPGGDLIRVLVNSSLSEAVLQVVEWFHKHHNWPMLAERWVTSMWLREALGAERWPDQDRLRECVQTIARRVLPIAERRLHLNRFDTFAITVNLAVNSRGIGEMPDGRWVSSSAAYLADLHRFIVPSGEVHVFGVAGGGDVEYREQVHVVAWVWLGLPPLRKERSLEVSVVPPRLPPPPASEPEPPRRPWWRQLFGGG